MKKILFLSSALIMTMCSAFAEDAATTDKKITGGAGTCTVDVLGVSDNNATANTIATWSLNSYDCAAGQYLDETTLLCTECPTGSYCPGGVFTVEANNSKTACPTDYTSDTAATAESECYMGCELACGTNVECPPHSNNCTHSEFTTTGRQYVDATCNAYPSVCPIADFGCDMGYHKSAVDLADFFANLNYNTIRENTLLECSILGQDVTIGETNFMMNLPDNGINDCDIIPPGTSLLMVDNYVITAELTVNAYGVDTPGVVLQEYYHDFYNTTNYFKYLPNANFTSGIHSDDETLYIWGTFSKIGVPSNATYVLMNAFSEFQSTGSLSDDTLNALQTNLPQDAWSYVQTLLGKIQSGTISSEAQMMSEMRVAYAKTLEQIPTNIPWAYGGSRVRSELFDTTYATSTIFLFLMINAFGNMDDADTLFPYIETNVSYCTNNTINIDWNPDNNGEHIKNMCTYDGAITLPDDPVKPGYTFMGWKLLEETTTE